MRPAIMSVAAMRAMSDRALSDGSVPGVLVDPHTRTIEPVRVPVLRDGDGDAMVEDEGQVANELRHILGVRPDAALDFSYVYLAEDAEYEVIVARDPAEAPEASIDDTRLRGRGVVFKWAEVHDEEDEYAASALPLTPEAVRPHVTWL